MSRRLPIVGSPRAATSDARLTSEAVACFALDGVVRIAVVDARSGTDGTAFAAMLVSSAEQAGRVATVTRRDRVPDGTLVVLLGMDTPRPRRTAHAQAIWSTADVLLSMPSELVARVLVAAL